MKKILLAVLLIGLANTLSSALPNENEDCFIYLIYIGSGDQSDISNYDQQVTQPSAVPGSIVLAWICIVDLNCDGTIDAIEFGIAFAQYDTNSNGTLDDEVEVSGKLEKRG